MAKDYFQDILPPDDAPRRPAPPAPQARPDAAEPAIAPAEAEKTRIPINTAPSVMDEIEASGEKSIRNISVQRRSRPISDMREPAAGIMVSAPRRGGAKWLLWVGAGASVLVLGLLVLVAIRSTAVQVTPRSQTITFSPSSQFTAYPSGTAASGTLAYTVRTLDLDDSEVVQSQGMVHAEEKASGSIVVYNDFQTSPLRLVKNTRFSTADGLIFRTPADIVVPAKKGSTPGQITVTVIADQPGAQYNVAAGTFTVPGLKSSPSYTHVYARSSQAMAGGFVGERPGVDEASMSAAKAAVRSRLEAKARDSIGSEKDALVIPDLVQITYQDDAPTTEAGGGVRIREKAHVVIPIFAMSAFASTIAEGAGIADPVAWVAPGSDFGAQLLNASTTVGSEPIQFTLSGTATVVWSVDAAALQKALAGKPQSSFQGIVQNFPGIQEAHARVEPFWKSTFPTDPAAIKVSIGAPKSS